MLGGLGKRRLIGGAVLSLLITLLLSLGRRIRTESIFGTGGRTWLDDGQSTTMTISVADTRPWTAAVRSRASQADR
jgi:hypothetical protein